MPSTVVATLALPEELQTDVEEYEKALWEALADWVNLGYDASNTQVAQLQHFAAFRARRAVALCGHEHAKPQEQFDFLDGNGCNSG